MGGDRPMLPVVMLPYVRTDLQVTALVLLFVIPAATARP